MRGAGRSSWIEIDDEALRLNVSWLRRTVHPALLCAVVKANAYGHSAKIVARAAEAAGAAMVAVATTEEGIELQEAGISIPILLLSEPERDAVEEAVARGFLLSLYSVRTLVELISSWERLLRRYSDLQRPRVHLIVDTGMHRIGCSPREIAELARLSVEGGIEVEGLASHFAVADGGEEGRQATHEQIRRFEVAQAQLAAVGVAPKIVHIANSAGAIAYPSSRYDMVRCGMAMYGYSPSEHVFTAGLKPILTLKARVSHVQRLESGEAVSYGLMRRLSVPSTIATVPIGYADGVPRRLFERGGELLLGGQRVPIAGTVTMDQLMIDAGDQSVRLGDEVVLIGRQGQESISANEWAELCETTVYEILTRLGPRLLRTTVGGLAEERRDVGLRA
jgi:alanine racemase